MISLPKITWWEKCVMYLSSMKKWHLLLILVVIAIIYNSFTYKERPLPIETKPMPVKTQPLKSNNKTTMPAKTSSQKTKPVSKPSPTTYTESRDQLIKKQFSPWDGSHRALNELIKISMNDPGSYKHVDTVYWDRGDFIIVRTSFRGKNVFGAYVLNWVKVKVDLNGNILEIIEQGP